MRVALWAAAAVADAAPEGSMRGLRPLHRLIVAIGMPLLMLLAQQGAVVHELGHLHEELAPSTGTKRTRSEALCVTCLAFAAIAGAAKPDAWTLLLLAF